MEEEGRRGGPPGRGAGPFGAERLRRRNPLGARSGTYEGRGNHRRRDLLRGRYDLLRAARGDAEPPRLADRPDPYRPPPCTLRRPYRLHRCGIRSAPPPVAAPFDGRPPHSAI